MRTEGIAGPSGGTPEKPVGLVHIHNRIVQHRPVQLGERLSIRVRARFRCARHNSSAADVGPVHQHADAGGADGSRSYGRPSYHCSACRSSCNAGDAHRGQRSPYPGLCAIDGQRKTAAR